jgi:hypothetical protein
MDNIDGKGDSFANFVKQVCESSIVAGVEFVSAESNVETGEVFLKRYRYEQLVTEDCSATHPAELPRDRHYTKPRRHLF